MVLDSNKNNTRRNIKRKDLRGKNKTDIQKRKTKHRETDCREKNKCTSKANRSEDTDLFVMYKMLPEISCGAWTKFTQQSCVCALFLNTKSLLRGRYFV
jgi:hypothetical protein